MKKIKIFIDSNVLIAGLASDKGASHKLLKLIEARMIEAYFCQLIFEEVERNLKKKLPESLPYLYGAIKILSLNNLPTSRKLDKKLNRFFPKKSDQTIFETANKIQLDFFVTLNRKHFHTRDVKKLAHFKICTPAQFLDDLDFFNKMYY